MNKSTKVVLKIVATLLVLNGVLNIFDDGMVRTYDIASILSGIGFLIVVSALHKNK